MAEAVSKEVCNWYSGPSFFELVDGLPLPDRKADGALRVPVLDKMRDQGLNLFGKVESGVLYTGNLLLFWGGLFRGFVDRYDCDSDAVQEGIPDLAYF